ncbi:hypothetical protein PRUPE_8G021100 [Prunus persica]|uniref:PGG domain-containing protein n=1 Tax=Prunus persica TaxID=3760 RepID=A0A251MRJ8_PRUPE|nr:hypothetical protein PRUPE_8G021100 [Prunus persica]
MENKTAEQLFNSEHAKLLQSAQTWIKETAQSCLTVAALVATVVYAAAYTAPRGNDSNGVPVLRHSSFFFTFAVADTVSLISSLASLVTFLSILTSPLEYQDFYRSLPFKLHLGFTLLFFSLITTMLTFIATTLLLIHPQKKWTTPLVALGETVALRTRHFQVYQAVETLQQILEGTNIWSTMTYQRRHG